MKRKHQRTLELIFVRPVSGSVPWRDVLALFQELGAEIGEEFAAGRMGNFKIDEDPVRAGAKRVLMGPFTVYNKDNVEAAAK